MQEEIKAILIQDGEPTPNNPVEIKRLLVNKEAEDYITNLQTIEREYSAVLSENAELRIQISAREEEYIKLQEEIERLNNIIEQIKEYIEYSLNNPFADERMILEMVLAKIKVELKGDNK